MNIGIDRLVTVCCNDFYKCNCFIEESHGISRSGFFSFVKKSGSKTKMAMWFSGWKDTEC